MRGLTARSHSSSWGDGPIPKGPGWRGTNLVCSLDGEEVRLERQPLPTIRPDLIRLFDRAELAKYLTDEELAEFDAAVAQAGAGNALAGEAK